MRRIVLCGIFVFSLFIIGACTTAPATTGDKLEGEDCQADVECASGVCNFVKQYFGECAPTICTVGSQAQGTRDLSFFCNEEKQWQKIKAIGESCSYDFECFRETGKDCPGCHPEDYKYFCKDNVCVKEKRQNECEKQGLKRITSKDDADWNRDGSCFKTLAQRQEITVCAPCGNDICDAELESNCNCPEDCG